jgi:hypothetical protein
MKIRTLPFFIILGLSLVIISSCKKTLTYQGEPLTDYFQLQSGKTITYRLDSTNFTNYGTATTTTSYIVEDVVDTTILDNLGRTCWLVSRNITDTAETQGWSGLETYTITPTPTSIEVNENNLRYVMLAQPITQGFTWPGNNYIGPVGDDNTPDPTYMEGWDYTYDSVGGPFTVLAGTIPNTLYILQANVFEPDSTNLASTSYLTYSVEVYAKGVGLIYKDFLHWFYEPPGSNGNSQGYRIGYGIRLNMIGHN